MLDFRRLFVGGIAMVALAVFSAGCIHGVNPAEPHPLFISHRGESSVAPENTAAAFKYAMEHGSDGFETDIHLTSDGVVVCNHDCNTIHVFGKDLRIEEHTYAELQGLAAKPHADRFPKEGVPTLAEALEILKPRKKIFIEVKDNNPKVVDAMHEVVCNSRVGNSQVVVISFHADAIKYCKEMYPQYKTLWLCGFARNQETGEFIHGVDHYIRVLKDIHADGIDCAGDFDFMTPDFYNAMHEAGLEVIVWTIDNTDDARRFVEDGVDGVTTNRAVELIRELRH